MSIDLEKIRNFLLFFLIFAMTIDPTRSMLRITEAVFFLFLVVSFPKANYKYLFIISFLFFSYFASLALNVGVVSFDRDRMFSLFVGLFFTLLLLFVTHFKNFFRYFFICAVIMSVIVISLSVTFIFNRTIALVALALFKDDFGNIMFSESKSFLSLNLISVFYKSSPIAVVALGYSMVQWFQKKKIKYLVFSALLFLNLFFSGTRANILSAVFITGFITLLYLYFIRRRVFLSAVLFVVAGVLALFLTIILLTQTGEASLEAKSLHQETYFEILDQETLQTLLIGFGPGSEFYSAGFKQIVASTELSYLELIRNYGLVNSLVIIFIFFFPVIQLIRSSHYSSFQKYSMSISILAYLFIAGTNPFLNSMLGYLFLALSYSMSESNIFIRQDSKK